MPPMHFADWVHRHAVARPTKAAIVTPRARLTYAEFYRAALTVARRLAECGIGHGQTIALCTQSHALLAVLLVALNRLGVVTLTRDAPPGPDESINVPDGVSIDRFVIEQPFTGRVPEGAICVDLEWLKQAEGEAPDLEAPGFRNPDEVSTIFTTSGTTGSLKAVGFSGRQLMARLLKYSIGLLGEGRSETTFSHFGLGTVPGFRIAFETFWAGGTLFLGWPTRSVPEVISRNRIVRMYGSPAQYQAILRTSDPTAFDLSSLRYALVAGSTMPRPLIVAVRTKLCGTLINLYGSTELGLIAFGRLTERDQVGRCGLLVPWIEAQVVDGDDVVLKHGAEGVLRLRCAEMITGYINDPMASAECFKESWFYPGDTGHIDEHGTLTITGRVSERINAGGVKARPESIEEAALSFEGIAECAAFGVPDAMGVHQIWLALVANQEIDFEKLRSHCTARLGASAPRQFLTLAELPRNQTGKVIRGALVDLAEVRSRTPKP